MGNKYTYTHDEMGRRTSVTDPLGNITSYKYCLGGKLDTIIYPNGSMQTYQYDCTGRMTKMTKPDGTSVSLKYDKVGNIIEETNNLGQTYCYRYDELNRRIAIIAPNGGQRTFSYDVMGNMTKMTDEMGNETAYVYSPNGNLTHVMDALGNEVRYEYDCMNRLCKEERIGTVEDSQTTTYQWNKAGRMVEMTDPLGYQETYSYNKNGLLLSKIDRDGYQTAYTYDAVGSLTNILYDDGREVAYNYNELRQLKEVNDWIGKTSIEMDALGRPLSVTTPDGKTVSYRWGNTRRQTDMMYPDGTALHYEYDEAGRLKALSDGNNITTYAYDDTGKLTEKVLPNGIRTTYSYNELGRIESLKHEGGEIAEGYRFTYDARGNKIQAVRESNGAIDESRSFIYEYDALNQLVSVNRQNQVLRTYAYDAFGNRTEKMDFTGEQLVRTTYQYNAKNQLVVEVENEMLDAEKSYSYDGRGNLIQITQNGQVKKQFAFDETNQLGATFEVVNQMTKAARYDYNGLGQRIGQEIFKENTVESLHALTKLNPAEAQMEKQLHYLLDMTRSYNNLLESQEVVSGRRQRFFWDADVVAMQEEGEEQFYLQDGQGSVMNLTDATGKETDRYEFDEFGLPLERSFAMASQPFAFAGYQMDEVGGMYFAQARRYDANTGRFISEDKVRGFIAAPFTLNHYTYCWNRPVDMVDLDGRWPSWDEVKDWWNTNIYGEETVVSEIEEDNNSYSYWGEIKNTVLPSDTYTGKIIKKVITEKEGGLSVQYSMNLPSIELDNGWKIGIPAMYGITVGTDGISFDRSVGIDLGKLSVDIPSSIGVNWEDLVSYDLSINAGWDKDSVGVDFGIGLHWLSNFTIGAKHKYTEEDNEDVVITDKAGLYAKMAVVYAIVPLVFGLCGLATGQMDLSTLWNQVIQMLQSAYQSGNCPLK